MRWAIEVPHTLLEGSAALGIAAIDGVYVDFRDSEGLRREAHLAREDGFSGQLAIHPEQVAAINAVFTPSAGELEWARRVVAAFEAAGGGGGPALEGEMIDRPHWLLARRILAAGAASGPGGQKEGD